MPTPAALPDHWVIVLAAVVELCETEPDTGVTTTAVTQRLREANQHTPPVRPLLRTLRRHGFLQSTAADGGGRPLKWAPTHKAHAYLTPPPQPPNQLC